MSDKRKGDDGSLTGREVKLGGEPRVLGGVHESSPSCERKEVGSSSGCFEYPKIPLPELAVNAMLYGSHLAQACAISSVISGLVAVPEIELEFRRRKDYKLVVSKIPKIVCVSESILKERIKELVLLNEDFHRRQYELESIEIARKYIDLKGRHLPIFPSGERERMMARAAAREKDLKEKEKQELRNLHNRCKGKSLIENRCSNYEARSSAFTYSIQGLSLRLKHKMKEEGEISAPVDVVPYSDFSRFLNMLSDIPAVRSGAALSLFLDSLTKEEVEQEIKVMKGLILSKAQKDKGEQLLKTAMNMSLKHFSAPWERCLRENNYRRRADFLRVADEERDLVAAAFAEKAKGDRNTSSVDGEFARAMERIRICEGENITEMETRDQPDPSSEVRVGLTAQYKMFLEAWSRVGISETLVNPILGDTREFNGPNLPFVERSFACPFSYLAGFDKPDFPITMVRSNMSFSSMLFPEYDETEEKKTENWILTVDTSVSEHLVSFLEKAPVGELQVTSRCGLDSIAKEIPKGYEEEVTIYPSTQQVTDLMHADLEKNLKKIMKEGSEDSSFINMASRTGVRSRDKLGVLGFILPDKEEKDEGPKPLAPRRVSAMSVMPRSGFLPLDKSCELISGDDSNYVCSIEIPLLCSLPETHVGNPEEPCAEPRTGDNSRRVCSICIPASSSALEIRIGDDQVRSIEFPLFRDGVVEETAWQPADPICSLLAEKSAREGVVLTESNSGNEWPTQRSEEDLLKEDSYPPNWIDNSSSGEEDEFIAPDNAAKKEKDRQSTGAESQEKPIFTKKVVKILNRSPRDSSKKKLEYKGYIVEHDGRKNAPGVKMNYWEHFRNIRKKRKMLIIGVKPRKREKE